MHKGIDIPVFDGRTDKSRLVEINFFIEIHEPNFASGSPVNLVSAWIDGSAIYGMSAEHENLLRSWQNGTLKACDRISCPI